MWVAVRHGVRCTCVKDSERRTVCADAALADTSSASLRKLLHLYYAACLPMYYKEPHVS